MDDEKMMSCYSNSSLAASSQQEFEFWRKYIGGNSLQLFEKKNNNYEEEDGKSEVVVSSCCTKKATDTASSTGQRHVIRIKCKIRTGGKQETRPMKAAAQQQEPQTTQVKAAAANNMAQPIKARPRLPLLAKPTGNKVADNVEKKFEATKRKMREAYDRVDLTKRIKRTQILDVSEASKLQKNNNNKPAMGTKNNTNRGTTRFYRR